MGKKENGSDQGMVINPLTGKEMHISSTLIMLASQEGCDGEPYDQMQYAAEYIRELESLLILKQGVRKRSFRYMEETHCTGMVSIENIEVINEMITKDIDSLKNADLGIMIENGKVWICVNEIALLRFKPKYTKGGV